MRIAALLIVVAACQPNEAPPDSAISYEPDCHVVTATISCVNGAAISNGAFAGGTTSHTLCNRGPISDSATCAQGCAITGSIELQRSWGYEGADDLFDDIGHAAMLCKETQDAKLGDACPGALDCRPTRAVLAADGTVATETYLRCGNGSCGTITAPVIAGYLGACDAATLSRYGVANAHGVVAGVDRDACLLAWDDTAQAITSGITRQCVGDWQCPDGSLCDDAIPVIDPPNRPIAVCKPGPRGALTPAMLAK